MFIKDKTELNNLTINELILLYFETISEANNPHIKVEGGSPYKSYIMKQRYILQHKNQAKKIIQLLKKCNINTSYLYLRYRYIRLKYFRDK